MKRAIIVIWCLLYIFMACACRNGEPSSLSTRPSGTADTAPSSQSTHPSGTADTTPSTQSTETDTTAAQEDSYKNLVCEKVSAFQQVAFCVSDSRTQVQISFPKHWTLKESDKGYNILQASKVIGSVTVSDAVESETPESVHSQKVTRSNVNIISRIDRIDAEGDAEYIRNLSYRYKEIDGTSSTFVITVPYQQIDDDAVWTMMTKVKKHTATDPQMGVLPLPDGRKDVLILGNSFVGSSRIGAILQKMCGTSLQVEAQSRGYARVTTYVTDESVMDRIRAGNYAAVILCGLYEVESLVNVEHMVNACASSNTQLAIFPAHNEKETLVGSAGTMYPSVTILNWKAEIESLIAKGIAETHFCVADSHKHSTPLAGYVGAHMIYRAIFGEIPGEKSYSEVTKSEISLLGDYSSTGSVTYFKPDSIYPIEAG